MPHETLGEIVVSCIVREAGRDLSADAVIRFLKARLASYKVPREVVFVTEKELKFTGTAKVKPADARELAVQKLSRAVS